MSPLGQLATVIPRSEPVDGSANDSHPMREVTRQVAESSDGWNQERAQKVRELFDSLAPEWAARATEERAVSLSDALSRGGDLDKDLCLEVGCGSGNVTPLLLERFDSVISMDLSMNMINAARSRAKNLLQGDASALPFAKESFDVIVVVNMFLFPWEYRRILRPEGRLIWVSSLGDHTPIYLHPDYVAQYMGEAFTGVWADAGVGRWASLWRSGGGG